MTSKRGLASMPQEILVMMLEELFTGMIVKKITFSASKRTRSSTLKRSWLPIMLVNKNISRIAKDVFGKKAIMVMKAAQLITTPPVGMAAQQRCGEQDLHNFEQVTGDLNFAKKYLRYTSIEHIRSRPKRKLKMFKKLKKIHLNLDDFWSTSHHSNNDFQTTKNLMQSFAERNVACEICLSVVVQSGHRTKVLVNSEGQAELVEFPTMRKSEAERIRKAVNEQLNCNLQLSYQFFPFMAGDQTGEILRRVVGVRVPRWCW